jgi:hypothetical protein
MFTVSIPGTRFPKRTHPARQLPFFALLSGTLASACHSAGPYGHSVRYEMLSDESRAVASVAEFDPVMARRFPEDYRKKSSSLFGIVMSKTSGTSGAAYVTLSLRRLLPRNLCSNRNDEESCRVSITAQEFGRLHVIIRLRPEDEATGEPLQPGSLLRIVGNLEEAPDKDDGSQVLRASFYRHFPPRTYRTNDDAEQMRQ